MSAPSRFPGGAEFIERVSDALEHAPISNFPWRWNSSLGASDPWQTLVAEMMLQRTRAEQVEPVFEKFVALWPTPEALNKAPAEKIERILRPLGLHRIRAQRLKVLAGAVLVGNPFDLPNGTIAFAGIGRYTHRAVACFAYGAHVGIVDVNVLRVLKRVFGLRTNGRDLERRIESLADHIAGLDGSPAWRNYALLDVGREYCKTKKPRCGMCPLRDVCRTGGKVPHETTTTP